MNGKAAIIVSGESSHWHDFLISRYFYTRTRLVWGINTAMIQYDFAAVLEAPDPRKPYRLPLWNLARALDHPQYPQCLFSPFRLLLTMCLLCVQWNGGGGPQTPPRKRKRAVESFGFVFSQKMELGIYRRPPRQTLITVNYITVFLFIL